MTATLNDLQYWEDAAHWALTTIHQLETTTEPPNLAQLIEARRVLFPAAPEHEWWADLYAAVQQRCNPNITDADLLELLNLKQSWYGPQNIMAFGAAGIIVRLSDKMARLENLESMGLNPDEETVADTLIDMLGYGVLGVMVQYGLMELPLAATIR